MLEIVKIRRFEKRYCSTGVLVFFLRLTMFCLTDIGTRFETWSSLCLTRCDRSCLFSSSSSSSSSSSRFSECSSSVESKSYDPAQPFLPRPTFPNPLKLPLIFHHNVLPDRCRLTLKICFYSQFAIIILFRTFCVVRMSTKVINYGTANQFSRATL